MTNPSSQQFRPIFYVVCLKMMETLGKFYQGWVLLIILVISLLFLGRFFSNHQKALLQCLTKLQINFHPIHASGLTCRRDKEHIWKF